MNRNRAGACGMLLAAALTLFAFARPAAAQDQQPSYTPAEYNAYIAATKETNPDQRIALLEAFAQKFPASTLLPYVYSLESQTFTQEKKYADTVKAVDKLLALGDKIDATTRLNANYTRAQAYYLGAVSAGDKSLLTPEQLTAARNSAADGLKGVAAWQKPATATDDQYNQLKKTMNVLFNSIIGITATQQKDYKSAADALKAAVTDQPDDGSLWYRLGGAYFGEDPPKDMDGFWALGRAIALKVPGDAQVRDYLKKRIAVYEQALCDSVVDSQVNELVALAAKSADRPADYTIPSAADLDQPRHQTATFIQDLQAGGDKGKLAWTAFCGQDFPEIPAKAIEVSSTPDSVLIKVYIISQTDTDEQVAAVTTPNADVKIAGQPEAAKFQKDDYFRFAGTLTGYDPSPFMLHWDKVKVNPEDLPSEKKPAGKRSPRRAAAKPGK